MVSVCGHVMGCMCAMRAAMSKTVAEEVALAVSTQHSAAVEAAEPESGEYEIMDVEGRMVLQDGSVVYNIRCCCGTV